MRVVSRCFGTKDIQIGRPMPGLDFPGLRYRIEDFVATGLLVVGHLEVAIDRPTPSEGHREYEVDWSGTWFSDLHLVIFPLSNRRWRLSHFPLMGTSHFSAQ